MNTITDVAIIGAGPAGLQAALTLGRMHRSVVVLDAGRYRNDRADAMHNLIGHDGQTPAAFRAAARAELARYDSVRFVAAEVGEVTGAAGGFRLSTGEGDRVASRVILATGMRDTLPDIPGIEAAFGSSVAHCPFCHGHEFAGRPVALIGPGPFLEHMSALMAPIASALVAFPRGGTLDEGAPRRLALRGTEIEPAPVLSARGDAEGIDLALEGGGSRRFGGALVQLATEPAAPHAARLGVERSELGAVLVDPFGRSSVPGVYAAGDIAQQRAMPAPMWAVWSAIATGAAAATGALQDIVAAEAAALERAVPA